MRNPSEFYSNCRLCPRNCGADRRYEKGVCGCSDVMEAARAGLHYYEEPFLSGVNGSGTVFFTGCSLGCIYCQNFQISHSHFGIEIEEERLARIFLEQQERRAHNINLVTGTHFTPSIARALQIARNNGLRIPVIWNSSGYEKPEILNLLSGLADIFMPDFKTLSPDLGARYMKAPDYPERAAEALKCMVDMTGPADFEQLDENRGSYNENGDPWDGIIMKRGIVVRHLVIPGHTKDSMEVIRYLYETFGDRIWISIMSQYTPVGAFAEEGNMKTEYPELCRTLTPREYDKVVNYAIGLGIRNCMIQQEGTASSSFIPLFDGTGITSKL